MTPTKNDPPADDDTDDDTDDDDEPATAGQVKEWIDDALAPISDALAKLTGGGDDKGGPPPADDKGAPAPSDGKPASARVVEHDVSAQVEAAVAKVFGEREHAAEHAKLRDGKGDKTEPETAPVKPSRLRDFLWGKQTAGAK